MKLGEFGDSPGDGQSLGPFSTSFLNTVKNSLSMEESGQNVTNFIPNGYLHAHVYLVQSMVVVLVHQKWTEKKSWYIPRRNAK